MFSHKTDAPFNLLNEFHISSTSSTPPPPSSYRPHHHISHGVCHSEFQIIIVQDFELDKL